MSSQKEHSIIGTWRLKSIYYKNGDGDKTNLYGENPLGILMYDISGYVNAQLGSNNRLGMKSNNGNALTTKDKEGAFDSFMAYYGKYYEKEPGVMIHQIEGCINPNWLNKDEIRYFRLKGDILEISTPKIYINGIEAVIEVLWKRVDL